MPYKFICQTCNKPFETDMWNRKFCSRPCMYKGYKKPSNPVDVICEHCGKAFQKFPGSHNLKAAHHFCTPDCRRAWQQSKNPIGSNHSLYRSVEVPCSHCSKILTRKPYRIRDYKEQFCNHTCFGQWRAANINGANHPNWKGGRFPYYGPNWQQQATKARKRDNHTCQHCGISESKIARKLDVHHIVPIREFDYVPGKNDNYRLANKLSNLITLCQPCHRKIEHGKDSIQLLLVSSAITKVSLLRESQSPLPPN